LWAKLATCHTSSAQFSVKKMLNIKDKEQEKKFKKLMDLWIMILKGVLVKRRIFSFENNKKRKVRRNPGS
jgi:Tfp pilus assembly ATPase PilU